MIGIAATTSTARATVRQQWRISGQVQGVGFRPFVHRIANLCHVTGWVLNDSRGVLIEAQGSEQQVAELDRALRCDLPPLARIDRISSSRTQVLHGEQGFVIRQSDAGAPSRTGVAADVAVCADCLGEMAATDDRRFGHALITCTNCGPRYTIIRHIPYDRPNTTMAGFAMCPRCRDEYGNPADRRFHAQAIACHDCGPKLTLVDGHGRAIEGDPVSGAAQLLREGRIVAVKSTGGYHLAVRADDAGAVARLRQRKGRERKPFAVLVRDLAEARRLVELGERGAAELASPAAPIVLSQQRPAWSSMVAANVAPGSHRLGVMLPNTPMQHLLLAAGCPTPLVMTSANLSEEPLIFEDADAAQRLGGICDAILGHDRPIERPVDDSVALDMGDDDPLPIRRARGYVPRGLMLPIEAPEDGLCFGGELKNTVAVVRDGEAILSQHLGDLGGAANYALFERTIQDLCRLFEIRPRWIAHDLHPAYMSSRWAAKAGGNWGVPLIAVQHHHAHAAAVMAEHDVRERALAVVCDGVGYGSDGSSWGGELLVADLCGFERIAGLAPLALPGGDAAARDGRRCALAMLRQALGACFASHPAALRLVPDQKERAFFAAMIERGLGCTSSSGAGRYFDGAAALLGICGRSAYEAEAPMRLEAAAAGARGRCTSSLFALTDETPRRIDLALLTRYLLERQQVGDDPDELAWVFHDQLAAAWEAAVAQAVGMGAPRKVVLSGGVFCNRLLTHMLSERLAQRGIQVLRHRLVPPGDGGLALGQAAVAAARLKAR